MRVAHWSDIAPILLRRRQERVGGFFVGLTGLEPATFRGQLAPTEAGYQRLHTGLFHTELQSDSHGITKEPSCQQFTPGLTSILAE